MKSWLNCLRFDLIAGRRYLIASAALGFTLALLFLAGGWIRAASIKVNWNEFTLGDNFMLLFGGLIPPNPNDQVSILFPIGWLLLLMGYMLTPILYTARSCRGYLELNAAIRGGGRLPWFASKCLWVALSSLVFWIPLFAAVVTATQLTSGDLSPYAARSIEAIGVSRNDNLINGPYALESFLLALPAVSTLLLIPLAVLSLLSNELVAYLVGLGCLVSSVMSCTGVIPGEYLMALRTSCFLSNGITISQALTYALALCIVATAIGAFLFRTKNLLGGGGLHD